MSAFVALDRVAMKTQEAVFGDTFTYQPMTVPANNGNAAAIVDTTRAAATVPAILTYKQEKPLQTRDYDPRADRRPGASLTQIEIEVDGRFGLDIKRHDTFTRTSDSAAWRVHSTNVTDTGRTIAVVNEVN